MKRIKIMLMSIGILAIVGSSLALKAKKELSACTIPAAIIGGQIVCNPLGQQICPVVFFTTEVTTTIVCTWTQEGGATECPTELCTVPIGISIGN